MPFPKGISGNPGGRTSPRTNRIRTALAEVVEANADKLGAWLEEVYQQEGAKAAIQCLTGMAEYCVPKLARTEIAGDADNPLAVLSDEQILARIAANAASLGIPWPPPAQH